VHLALFSRLLPKAAQKLVSARTITFAEVDVLTLDLFEHVMMEGFPEAGAIRKKVVWWSVMRAIQYSSANDGRFPPHEGATGSTIKLMKAATRSARGHSFSSAPPSRKRSATSAEMLVQLSQNSPSVPVGAPSAAGE
jgi:hypothetical protein